MMVTLDKRFIDLSEEDFFLFCQSLHNFRVEKDTKGNIMIMEPTGSEGGSFNMEVSYEVKHWDRQNRSGKTFDSSTGFTLPNHAVRSPDTAWIALERWLQIPKAQRKRFAPISPDFVIEIRSEGDRLDDLQAKMIEYRDNGVRLGWLIDPLNEETWVYRQDGTIDHHTSFSIPLSGEEVLPGFELKLLDFWEGK